MNRLEPLVFGVLLLVTLGFARSVWQGDEPAALDTVIAFDPGKGGLKTVAWDDERSVATLQVSEGDAGPTAWVSAGKREKIEPPTPVEGPQPEGAAEPTPAPTPAEPTYGDPLLRSFPGNKAARTLVKSLSPLKALREFRGLDTEAIEEMGLDEPKGTLVLTGSAGEARFEVGDKAYGSNDTYLRPAGEDRVFLISSKILGPLRGASNRLVERNPLTIDPADAVSLAVGSAGGEPRRLLHQGRYDKVNSYWALADNPEERDSGVESFVEKLFGLRVTRYPLDGEAREDVEVALVARFEGDSGPADKLSIGSAPELKPAEGAEPKTEWFVRTGRTRVWTPISRSTGEDLAEGLAAL